MRRFAGLFALLAVMSFGSGCSDHDRLTSPDSLTTDGNDAGLSTDPICESGGTMPLIAGKSREAGSVTMVTDGNILLVQIETADRWQLASSDVAVGASLDDIPQRRGKAKPNQFEHHVDHESGTEYYQHRIDISSFDFELGDEIFVAVRAKAERLNRRDEVRRTRNAWAAGEPFPRGKRARFVRFTLGECIPDGGEDPGEGGGEGEGEGEGEGGGDTGE